MSQRSKYVIRPDEIEPYSPANHTGTRNRRLIGPRVNGARHLEIVLGEIERISEYVAPGASLIVSDHGLGNETGLYTDFIVVTR